MEYFARENFTSRGLVASLRGEMPDDGDDEYSACDWLNECAPFTGAVWAWQDGDFGLWPLDDEEM